MVFFIPLWVRQQPARFVNDFKITLQLLNRELYSLCGVQTSHFPYHLIAGAQVEVVGIAKFHLSFQFSQVNGRNAALYSGRSPHVHETWGLESAVDGIHLSTACFIFGFK